MGKTGSKPTDELIILAQRGNGLAFTALWDRHIEQLRFYIKARFKNIDDYAADDICSRSFEKAFRQIMSYDQYKSRFLTWLCTIAKNTALTLWSKSREFIQRTKSSILTTRASRPEWRSSRTRRRMRSTP
ncbi:MAG: RNA polymerase sigma factor [Anaerovoracaceae bacterium]